MTGFLIIDKPEGITSFVAVAKVRRICGEKKAGHCGTLDPMATGVLPIMLGGATRFLDFLPDGRKRYIAEMRLGVTTDTLDITGTVTGECEVNVTASEVLAAAENFKGDIMQVPPMYSAIKKDGVRMYDLARRGVEVEREARPATIYELIVTHKEDNDYIVEVECSKGTYVRTLIDDIGKMLGCGAVMLSLRRTKSSGFEIQNSVTFEELEKAVLEGTVDSLIHSVDEVMDAYPKAFVSAGQAQRFQNGGSLNLERIKDCKADGLYRVYSPDEIFLGLGTADTQLGALKMTRLYIRR